ncbi:TetR/AcrR family transcriptional regulator [Ureibacillus acetophenoni]|uniref:TetR family transcriptional regulator n=1 Tax=Ureibacillus acetophenoni TaxID=614649 RepID=A0A285TYV5_9BACL|nr:TetR/AcrR family transcriptional regulator [Ureibacillus acetophenoni]SOC34890.1 TetR family transcriptional regulator [Ureibacillus acetophenoni]
MARGRKVNSSGERSMKLLREKAIELFSENGYFQTKISDIVKAAHVTQPTYYLYFESKEALYKDLLKEFHTNLEQIIDETVSEYQQLQDSKQTFQVILSRLFTYFATNPHLAKIGLNESNVEFVTEVLPQKFKSILENDLKSLQKQDVSIHILIQSLIGSIERLTLSSLLLENTNPEQLAEELVTIYFAKEDAVVTA